MSTVILILVGLAILHFVIDGILGPSIRMQLRYRLFAQRDRLRALKIEHAKQLDNEAFNLVHDSINTAILILPHVSVSMLIECRDALRSDEALRKRVEKRKETLGKCRFKELQDIHDETMRIAQTAFFVNTLGHLIYIIPLVSALFCFQKLCRGLALLIMVPVKELNRMSTFDDLVMTT